MSEQALVVIVIAAVAGALAMGLVFRHNAYSSLMGAALGAGAGVLGTLLFMAPLGFCPFVPVPEGALYKIGNEDVLLGGVLVAIGTLLFAVPMVVYTRWRAERRDAQFRTTPVSQGSFKGWALPIIFLAPTVIILLLFLYYPALDTFALSTQLAKLGARRSAFVCVDNFANLIIDASYYRTILTTFGIGIATVVIGMVAALAIATVAYLPIKGAAIYRTLLIWPYAISPAVAGIIFLLLFNPTGGVINYFLQSTLGIKIGWLNDPNVAPWAVIIASVWKSMGFNILFFLAGLQNVPKDLLEAAAIDGANAIQRYRNIVIPALSPITFFLIITNMTYAFFETFGTIDYLTSGGPLSSTTTLMYRVYQVGIVENDLGKGAAQSIMLFLMVIGLTLYQFRTNERNVSYGA
jgi:sn-glycerol 3-phosphate transport system permease protein